MARPGRLRFAPSHRDKLRAANASNLFYASMAGEKLAPELTNDIKPVRKYTQREGATPEHKATDAVRLAISALPEATLWRNTRGVVELPSGGRLRYGVGPNGASDLIGFVTLRVTPAMVGRNVAVFAVVEVKAPGRYATPEQRAFIERVQDAGGIAGVATSAAEARAILTGRE